MSYLAPLGIGAGLGPIRGEGQMRLGRLLHSTRKSRQMGVWDNLLMESNVWAIEHDILIGGDSGVKRHKIDCL